MTHPGASEPPPRVAAARLLRCHPHAPPPPDVLCSPGGSGSIQLIPVGKSEYFDSALEDAFGKVRKHAKAMAIAQKRRELHAFEAKLTTEVGDHLRGTFPCET